MTASKRDRFVVPIDGWVVDIARLRHDHRGRRTFGGAEAVTELVLPSAKVPTGEVRHELDVDAASTDVVVTGTVSFSWESDCRRCLEPVTGSETVELNEIFSDSDVDEEIWPIVDDKIDLEPAVRQAVLLALPISTLCGPDCAGPVGEYRVTLEANEAGESVESDPRWAALDDLEFD